jgi:hypothetical protein
MSKCKMDGRCPRQLKDMPDTWCPLSVLRLKAIRNAGRELTEEEEANLPGCPWSVNHQLANYCFFKFIEEYAGDKPLSDIEIASLNNVSVDTVKKAEKSGLQKIRVTEEFKEIKDAHGDGSIIADTDSDSDYTVYR